MQQAGPAVDDDEEMGVKEEEEEDDEEEDDGYYMDPRNPAAAVAVSTPGGRAGGTPNRRRAREEKERTKMRERQRRAITGRILAGLRQHGNYSLRARADNNEVIAALAREAGWVVLPDGTTFPSSSSAAVVAQVVALSRSSLSFPSVSISNWEERERSELAALRCDANWEEKRNGEKESELTYYYCPRS